LPLASFVVAVSCTVAPTETEGALGASVTLATGTCAAVTVTAAVADFPSLVAVIVTGPPAATPVTTPSLTLAIDASPLVHATARPLSAFPAESRGVATNVVVAPTSTLELAGVRSMLATAAGPSSRGAVLSLCEQATTSAATTATVERIERVMEETGREGRGDHAPRAR
jgi:hypothetical protein